MRPFPRIALVCIALFSAAADGLAQTTAEEVIAKNLEAKGGVQLLKDTHSVRMTGTISTPAGRGTTISMSKRPNQFRREQELSGQRMVQGFDGSTLWVRMGTMAPQEVPAGPQADALKRTAAEFDSPFIGWKEKGHAVDYKGKVTEGGREFHHLVFSVKDGPTMEYYIDPATWLEAKTVVQDPASKVRAEMRYGDYRQIDGRMIPFSMTNVVNGQQVMQMRLDRAEFNIPLDDALFRMPH